MALLPRLVVLERRLLSVMDQVSAEGCGCRSVPSVWWVLLWFVSCSQVKFINSYEWIYSFMIFLVIKANSSILLWWVALSGRPYCPFAHGTAESDVSPGMRETVRAIWRRGERGWRRAVGDRSQWEPSKWHVGMKCCKETADFKPALTGWESKHQKQENEDLKTQ